MTESVGKTSISASCPVCGPQMLHPTWVAVRTWTGNSARLNHYEFLCRSCRQMVRKPAPQDVIDLLASAGVGIQHTVVPDEVDDPGRSTFLPPITEDDVLDLINELKEATP